MRWTAFAFQLEIIGKRSLQIVVQSYVGGLFQQELLVVKGAGLSIIHNRCSWVDRFDILTFSIVVVQGRIKIDVCCAVIFTS